MDWHFKLSQKANQSSIKEGTSSDDDEELNDEQMAFFIKNFTRVLRKGNFRNFGKNKKQAGEAHLGQEWDSQQESESEKEDVATMAFKASSPHRPRDRKSVV